MRRWVGTPSTQTPLRTPAAYGTLECDFCCFLNILLKSFVLTVEKASSLEEKILAA